jgi:MFS family permease
MIRESGGSLTLVGFSALLSLPWLLKFLRAPLADRYFVPSFGRRKSWIVPAHMGMIVITLALAPLVKEHNLFVIAILFLVLNLFAATQDIGVDSLAVDVLDKKELGAGNAAQISGFKLGNLFGGGVLLALAGVIGWRGGFLIMTACHALSVPVHIWRLCRCAHQWYYGGCVGTHAGHADGQSHGDIIGANNHAHRLV